MNGSSRRGLVVQERDRHLLSELAVMHVIDREQAKCVAGFRSTSRANYRLLRLVNAGLLRRFSIGTIAGGKKALYTQSQNGAKLIGVPYRGLRRAGEQVLVADFFVTHQLLINQIYCAVKYRPLPLLEARFSRWACFYEPLQPAISLIPDGYFEISTPKKTIAAFLEVDLGHESHSVWKSKITGYLQYAVSGTFERQFNHPQFRVLVITNSERRMHSLRRTVGDRTEKVFWFSTFDSIARDGFWSLVWLRPKDDHPQPLM
jgi:hypothetical protein